MAGVLLRRSGLWVPAGASAPIPPPPPPEGDTSFWSSVAPVTGGWQLDPSVQKKTGVPPGTALTPTPGMTINTSNQTFTGRAFTGTVTIASGVTGLKFVRCTFTATNYTPHAATGGNLYLIVGGGRPDFIDCEFYGGNTIAAYAGGTFTRCYFTEGNDVFRLRHSTGTTFTECVIDGCLPANPDSHSDAIQATSNTPSSAGFELNIKRSWMSCFNRWTGNFNNAVVQSGAYGDPVNDGLWGTWEDNFFDGGNYTFNANGGHLDPKVILLRNRFGRNHRYGLFHPAFRQRSVINSTNVWADNGQPVLGA